MGGKSSEDCVDNWVLSIYKDGDSTNSLYCALIPKGLKTLGGYQKPNYTGHTQHD